MDDAPGWSAIDAACARIYGDEKPQHWGTLLKWSLGGEDPLDGVSAYTRTEPVPHWHYVSYGMSELYDKESEDADASGWGFEFTFRLVRRADQTEAPIWPANLMQNLARYVIQTGNWFAPGHHIDANGPIAADSADSLIRTLAFIQDPELGEIDTPNGAVQFLQLVGLTPDEYEAAAEWHTQALLALFEPRMPLSVTDIDRTSLLTPELLEQVRAGVERDGSNSGELMVDVAEWDLSEGVTLRFGTKPAERIGRTLRGRLPFGYGLLVASAEQAVGFLPADQFSAEQSQDGILTVAIPEAALDEVVAAFRPVAGRTPVASLPGVTIEIV
ncbi:suppressor of fused domain protein [Kibdelosporangium aridum]|uniref:Suppressor of fused protein (SUFU) n=1 Tax=Kibdelosporangium aridum TaxID=2030 RepID=A0A1W2DJV5_KIBAR|nr:suppressor of fused domain protein [Kibdelosporangium aridum]SMC97739.1 Suppressor of fused protein (SUFU) [Kibdelosporangium aridum]